MENVMAYFVGIDGGGSNLRVALTDQTLTVLAESHDATVNPSVIGRAVSAQRIQEAMRSVLRSGGITPAQVTGVGIGVAGAAADYAADWLVEVASAVVPGARVAPSTDIEIALVGAHGARYGVLVLAGTGSVALGIDRAGRSVRVGGWGFLLGDEGSGYWLGMEALRAIVQAADGRGAATALTAALLGALGLEHEKALIMWLYQAETPRNRDVARLAPLVCEVAAGGDAVARGIVEHGAQELLRLCRAVTGQLDLRDTPVAFAGGLLSNPTLLRDRLCELLAMTDPPEPLYPPVVGAALLARLVCAEA